MSAPSSLKIFLEGSLDYAGLFPPASLPLEPAVRNYAAYQSSPEAWMLSRFVCPAAQLAQLDPYAPLFAPDRPLAVSALGRKTLARDEFLSALAETLAAMRAFRERHGPRVSAEMLEMPLPATLDTAALPALLEAAADAIEASGLPRVTPFYEIARDETWPRAVDAMAEALAAHRADWARRRCQPPGFKLRCGGVEAGAFPTPAQVARALIACRDRGVPMKFTAGLHHPLRRYDASVRTKMHGFLNVFGAGVLARAHALRAEQVQSILESEDASRFRFDEAGFAWQDWRAPAEAVAEARASALLSFGSCSFEEPRDDLRALALL